MAGKKIDIEKEIDLGEGGGGKPNISSFKLPTFGLQVFSRKGKAPVVAGKAKRAKTSKSKGKGKGGK